MPGLRLFVFILLAALYAPRIAPAAERRTLLFLGDSLTSGYGLDDPAAQSYPALIRAKIEAEGLPWRVVNAGVSGDTSADGLARLGWVLRQRVDLMVLALGGNDGLRGIDPGVTRRNLEAIVDRVRARYPQATIVLAGMRMPPEYGGEYDARYARAFTTVAREKHVPLIPFLLQGVGGHPDLNQADGIHPNARGAAIVAETVWRAIRAILKSKPAGSSSSARDRAAPFAAVGAMFRRCRRGHEDAAEAVRLNLVRQFPQLRTRADLFPGHSRCHWFLPSPG
ncbi:MAG: arylesterase [Opitutaceae bacterium]